jgi:hypothetical protein
LEESNKGSIQKDELKKLTANGFPHDCMDAGVIVDLPQSNPDRQLVSAYIM